MNPRPQHRSSHPAPAGRGRRARGGFTLVELLLVLAITSVLALLVAPRFSAGSRNLAKLRDQAAALVALSRQARARALVEGRTYLVVVDPQERTLGLSRVRDSLAEAAGEEPERDEPGEDVAWARPLEWPAEVSLYEVEVTGEERDADERLELRFNPSGEADQARLLLRANQGADELAVVVEQATGLARVVDPAEEEE